jgi:hypothetical protein
MEFIINQLLAGRDKINAALDALRGPRVEFTLGPLDVVKAAAEPPLPKPHRHRTPAKKAGRRGFTPAQKEAARNRMKAYWAARRKAVKKAAK